MGKRSNFKRRNRDFYPTPEHAVLPLLPHLYIGHPFIEPCAGAGALMDVLEKYKLVCLFSCDITPRRNDIHVRDLFSLSVEGVQFITNPTWPAIGQKGEPTISMALHLSSIAPTWFLLSADFMHNKYFAKLQKRCVKIVSVGRVKWIPDSDGPGKDNCAWYLFDASNEKQTEFYGRAAK